MPSTRCTDTQLAEAQQVVFGLTTYDMKSKKDE